MHAPNSNEGYPKKKIQFGHSKWSKAHLEAQKKKKKTLELHRLWTFKTSG
jgi:hypothetical protein